MKLSDEVDQILHASAESIQFPDDEGLTPRRASCALVRPGRSTRLPVTFGFCQGFSLQNQVSRVSRYSSEKKEWHAQCGLTGRRRVPWLLRPDRVYQNQPGVLLAGNAGFSGPTRSCKRGRSLQEGYPRKDLSDGGSKRLVKRHIRHTWKKPAT